MGLLKKSFCQFMHDLPSASCVPKWFSEEVFCNLTELSCDQKMGKLFALAVVLELE